jgi:hypothetical protein
MSFRSHSRSKRNKRKKYSLSLRSKSFYTPLKSISITKSDQGEEGTCLAHACAHLILKNVFEQIIPLKLSNKDKALYELHSCNDYLKTHKLSEIHNDMDKCSRQGYYKILLFLYVYFTAYENFISKGKKQFLSPIISFVLQLEYIPKIFDQTFHLPLLLSLITFLKKTITTNHIKFDTVDIYTQDVIMIRKILDAGFYVAMNLIHTSQSRTRSQNQSPEKNPGHVSTIVSHTPSHFIVKNTWDETLDYVSYKDLNDVILVYSSIRWKIQNYFVVLPIFENMDLYDGFREDFVTDLEIEEREAPLYKKWLFDYISNFKKKK